MDDFTPSIGRFMLPRDKGTEHLCELEEEAARCIQRAAQELRRHLTDALSEEEAMQFAVAEELFVLLDGLRPCSVQAATAFLRRYGVAVPTTSAE